MTELDLRLPTDAEEAELWRAHRATSPETPFFLIGYEEGMSFRTYIDQLAAQARGLALPAGFVPSTFLFAFAAGRIVGRVSIRHELNDFLRRQGGHIGYVVVPEFRRRGYATQILERALRIAKDELGLSRVLVTCDDDNPGSIRTIEKNGGLLEGVVSGSDLPKPLRRYWVDTASQPNDQSAVEP